MQRKGSRSSVLRRDRDNERDNENIDYIDDAY